MRNEIDKLQANMRRCTGEDLSSLSLNYLNELEQELEFSVNRIRARKHQLLDQQLDNLLASLSAVTCMHYQINENQQVAPSDVKVGEMPLMMLPPPFSNFNLVEPSSTVLQLSPQLHAFHLLPTQPNCFD